MKRQDIDLFEVWRNIEEHPMYWVSSYGRVWSDKTNRILTQKPNQKGYLRVRIDGNLEAVARLVCKSFLPKIDGLDEVNHIDENKLNNCVENLEWCDRKTNVNYGNRMQKQIETNIKNGRINPEYVGLDQNERRKKYREDHRDRINYLKRLSHQRHRDEDNERVRKWRLEHPDYYTNINKYK